MEEVNNAQADHHVGERRGARRVAGTRTGGGLSALVAALPETPHTLVSGIEQVATGTEVPTEAKFEMEDGELMLSVYTSEAGLAVIPEENVFKEYKGPATGTEWDPKVEVFEDFAHIARSAQYHTLLSMTDVTIPDIVEKASAEGDTVISVKAKVRDGRPVFEVYPPMPERRRKRSTI